jgi:hypothetical protein
MTSDKMLPDPNVRPDPDYVPAWAAPVPAADDGRAEFTVPPGTDSPNAPLSPLRRMRSGETGERVN